MFVIAVDADAGARVVAERHDAAALVGLQPAAVGGARAFIPEDRRVDARAIDIAALQGVRGVVLRDEGLPVIGPPHRHPAAHALVEPAHRIIAERRGARPGQQTVLAGVAVAVRPVARQVAPHVIAEARAPRAQILVEPVARVIARRIDMIVPGIDVARRGAHDLAGNIRLFGIVSPDLSHKNKIHHFFIYVEIIYINNDNIIIAIPV